MNEPTLGIIGGTGWLGGAIANAVLAKNLLPASSLIVSNRSGTHPLAQRGVCLVADNQALVDRSDVVIIAVRPSNSPA
jgi:pyrroline-5-carboxylate reductase